MFRIVEGFKLLREQLPNVAEDEVADPHHHIGLEGVAEDLSQQLVLVALDVDFSQSFETVDSHLMSNLMLLAVVVLKFTLLGELSSNVLTRSLAKQPLARIPQMRWTVFPQM